MNTLPDGRYNVADPLAYCPPALLSPDGRYSCDRCDALTERHNLTTAPHGFFCPDCAMEYIA